MRRPVGARAEALPPDAVKRKVSIGAGLGSAFLHQPMEPRLSADNLGVHLTEWLRIDCVGQHGEQFAGHEGLETGHRLVGSSTHFECVPACGTRCPLRRGWPPHPQAVSLAAHDVRRRQVALRCSPGTMRMSRFVHGTLTAAPKISASETGTVA